MKHTLHTKTSAIWSMKNHHSRRKPHLRRVVSDNAPLPKIHLTIRQLKSCSNPASQSSSLEFIKPEKNIYKPHFSIFWSFPTVDLRLVFIYLKKRDLEAAPDSLASNERKIRTGKFLPKGFRIPRYGFRKWNGSWWNITTVSGCPVLKRFTVIIKYEHFGSKNIVLI